MMVLATIHLSAHSIVTCKLCCWCNLILALAISWEIKVRAAYSRRWGYMKNHLLNLILRYHCIQFIVLVWPWYQPKFYWLILIKVPALIHAKLLVA